MTLISPCPAKGLAILLRLVMMSPGLRKRLGLAGYLQVFDGAPQQEEVEEGIVILCRFSSKGVSSLYSSFHLSN